MEGVFDGAFLMLREFFLCNTDTKTVTYDNSSHRFDRGNRILGYISIAEEGICYRTKTHPNDKLK